MLSTLPLSWYDSGLAFAKAARCWTFIVVIVTGFLVANFVGKSLVSYWERVLDKIPLVRSIYSASKNFTEVLFTDTSQAFKKVLLIEYPRKGVYSLCFQTSTELAEIQGLDRSAAAGRGPVKRNAASVILRACSELVRR